MIIMTIKEVFRRQQEQPNSPDNVQTQPAKFTLLPDKSLIELILEILYIIW